MGKDKFESEENELDLFWPYPKFERDLLGIDEDLIKYAYEEDVW
jgi:hypothetical protein